MMSPLLKREAVTVLMDEHSFGARRACGLVQISASLYRYCSRRAECARRGERSCDKSGHEAPLRLPWRPHPAATRTSDGYSQTHLPAVSRG